jgi:hypothetical protein
MHCEDIQLDLIAYQQGGLPPERRAAIETHLASCQLCAEEATAMNDIGRLLSKGLKEWADQGTCPPGVMARLELSLRAERRPWYQRWPAYAGIVAAAAVFLVVFAARSMDLSQQVASIPLVGTLAAQLLYPGADVRVDDIPDGNPLAVDEHDGTQFALYEVTTGPKATWVKYALRGSALDTASPMNRYAPDVTGPKGALKLRNVRIQRAAGEVMVTAELEPVLPGQELTIAVTDIPLNPAQPGLFWQVKAKP